MLDRESQRLDLEEGGLTEQTIDVNAQRFALAAGGRAWIRLGSRKSRSVEKCSKTAQNPTSRLHAVLGSLAPTRTLTENQSHANLTRFYNELCF
jgi:hypothetical protein